MRYLSDGYPYVCRPKGRLSSKLSGVDDLLKRLGERIRQLRAERGWSQEQFADVCGVHRTYMGHLERGEKNVSFSSLTRVANALQINLADLFAGLEEGRSIKSAKGNRPRSRLMPRGLERAQALRELAAVERATAYLRTVLENSSVARPNKKS